jgi:5-methylcytosine-specific restriction protein A
MGAAMPISPVSADEIFKAMDRFDDELRASTPWINWESNQTHRYAIKKEGELYPVKQIISMATGVPTSSFGGGSEANNYLQERGFEIAPLRASEGLWCEGSCRFDRRAWSLAVVD